jgi:hypothetical protein
MIKYLVRTSFVTSVEVSEISSRDEILTACKLKLINQVVNELSENLDEIVEDTEGVVLIDETDEKTDADFYCDVTVTFFDKNGKLQTATVIHDGTEDCWDSQEIEGTMYDFNTYDTRVYGDSNKGAIGCGVTLLTKKIEGVWCNDESIDMVVNEITCVRKINQ